MFSTSRFGCPFGSALSAPRSLPYHQVRRLSRTAHWLPCRTRECFRWFSTGGGAHSPFLTPPGFEKVQGDYWTIVVRKLFPPRPDWGTDLVSKAQFVPHSR